VRFVFVNQGEPPATVQAYLASQGLHLDQVLIDPRSALGAGLGQRALPTTVFLDAQGRVVTQRIGELSPPRWPTSSVHSARLCLFRPLRHHHDLSSFLAPVPALPGRLTRRSLLALAAWAGAARGWAWQRRPRPRRC
jgi:hypothetical protein